STELLPKTIAALREEGFIRLVADGRTINISASDADLPQTSGIQPVHVVVDRIVIGQTTPQRLRESLETAFSKGDGRCDVYVESAEQTQAPSGPIELIDGQSWQRLSSSSDLVCGNCGVRYPQPEPKLFSFNS